MQWQLAVVHAGFSRRSADHTFADGIFEIPARLNAIHDQQSDFSGCMAIFMGRCDRFENTVWKKTRTIRQELLNLFDTVFELQKLRYYCVSHLIAS